MRRPSSLALVLTLVVVLPGVARAQLRATIVASGLTHPIAFVQDPSDPAVQVIVQQDGHVRLRRSGVVQSADFLDFSAHVTASGEQGLLGFAFAPDYASSGRFFISFTDASNNFVVSRFTRSPFVSDRADPSSRFDFVWTPGQSYIPHPYANHNGGNLAFGPDGYLYVGTGDGGSGDDPFHYAQNPLSLLGKMLRLDVQVADADPEGYDIPFTNPFVSNGGVRPEIWAFGLRNPWRWSFDDPKLGGTGALVVADVGQGTWEEVNYEPAGAGGRNYGWRNREAAHDHVLTDPPFSFPLRDPILEIPHPQGNCITGGFVYRGKGLGAGYVGRYFFADFSTSRVWSIGLAIDPFTHEASVSGIVEHTAELGAAAASLASFGVDSTGELYLVHHGGTIYRLDPPPGPPTVELLPGRVGGAAPMPAVAKPPVTPSSTAPASSTPAGNPGSAGGIRPETSSLPRYPWLRAR